MTVLVVETLVVLVVILATAAVAAGMGDTLLPAWRDTAPLPLPAERRLGAADVSAATFPVTVRGYRMQDVDIVLGRLAQELADRDAELADLRERLGEPAGQPAHAEPAPSPQPPRGPAGTGATSGGWEISDS